MITYVTCVSTGICIAQRESALNTAVRNPPNADGSRDYGIFRVSSRLFYNNKIKSLVSVKESSHAWSMVSLQKAVTVLSKFVVL